MATYTIDADTADGYVICSDATYSVARDGTGTLTAVGGASPDHAIVGQQVTASVYYCIEYFVSFDTSTVIGTPVSCELSLYAWSAQTLASLYNNFTAEARLYDWGAAVTSGDFIAGASLGALPLLATCDAAAFAIADTYVPFTENASNFVGNINPGGMTRLVITSSRHRLGTVPDVGPGPVGSATDSYEEIFFRQAEWVGAKAPQLVIVTAGGGWSVGQVRMGAN